MPFGHIFFHIYTSYDQHRSSAKRKSVIVRFVQRHKKNRRGDMIIRRTLLSETSHYSAQGSTKKIRRSGDRVPV
jgi:hypothetical protein